jgi:hypothetical protein
VIVSFKGSNSTKDWLTDLKEATRFRKPCVVDGLQLGNIHRGFCEYWKCEYR